MSWNIPEFLEQKVEVQVILAKKSSIEKRYAFFFLIKKDLEKNDGTQCYKLSLSVQYPIAKLVLRYMTNRNITQTFNEFLAHIMIYL